MYFDDDLGLVPAVDFATEPDDVEIDWEPFEDDSPVPVSIY